MPRRALPFLPGVLATGLLAGLAPALLLGAAPPAARTGVLSWPDLLQRPRPAADALIRYGDDPLQLVDLWLPAGPGPHPVVVMIHGGCWQTDIAERDIMNYIADDLRRDGIAVWNVEYRGVDRAGGGYPGTFQDVAAAADMLQDEAAGRGLDLGRVIAIGHSAGGHLALWLAARQALAADASLRGPRPLRIDAAISQGGLPDLRAGTQRIGHACGTEAPRIMAGDRFDLTSPPEMPVSDAAQYLFNTDADRVAPPAFAEAYRAAMAVRGVTVTTHVDAGEGHVELIAPGSASWAAQKALIKRLLHR